MLYYRAIEAKDLNLTKDIYRNDILFNYFYNFLYLIGFEIECILILLNIKRCKKNIDIS